MNSLTYIGTNFNTYIRALDFILLQLQTESEEQLGKVQFEEDSPALIDFVKRWEPFIVKQMGKNLRSHAFDGGNKQTFVVF